MQLALTGASGFLGRHVIRAAVRRGYEVTAFSRDPARIIEGTVATRHFRMDAPPDFTGCQAVIHLAGENVAGLWTRSKMRRIRESRIHGTERVAAAIRAMATPPEVLVSASAVGFYGDAGDRELSEDAPAGGGFLAETCTAWEAAAHDLPCRVVHARIGIVLGKGGALAAMRPIFRLCLGGTLGSGRQWMPWIHADDAAALLLFAVENLDVCGAMNTTAPWPVTNAEFTRTLARVLRRPAPWRVPAFMLRAVFGQFARELLDSKRVVPGVASSQGFRFAFPELEPALKDALA